MSNSIKTPREKQPVDISAMPTAPREARANRRPRQQSIRKNVAIFLISCAVLAGAFFAAVLFLDRLQDRLHATFVERTVGVGEIPIILDEMEIRLNEYMRTWNDAQLAEYRAKSGRLREEVEAASFLCRNAQSSLDYLRRIGAFNDYQEETLATGNASLIANYAPLSFVRMALGRQKIHAQEFAHSDLVLNRAVYMREHRRIQSYRVGLWGLFIALFSLMGFFVRRNLRRTAAAMSLVHDNLHSLSRREWDAPDLEPCGYVELDEIGGTANQMKHVIRDHIKRLEEHAKLERQLDQERLENERKERMLVEARVSVLKSQINPHFLFNTLNLIGKSAFLQEPELAMELIEATAKILRYSLNSTNREVTIQEEVDIASTYLYLQKNRFGPAVSYTVDVDEELWDHPVQPMILQPLAENCFKHGMNGRRSLDIRIRARLRCDALELSVRDNGKGFAASTPGGETGEGVGLSSIRRRLQLEYGVAQPVRIDSVPGEYAEVTLIIPVRKGRRVP